MQIVRQPTVRRQFWNESTIDGFLELHLRHGFSSTGWERRALLLAAPRSDTRLLHLYTEVTERPDAQIRPFDLYMSGSALAYTAPVFNGNPEVKRLNAASPDPLRLSRKTIEKLTVARELLSTMIEASNNFIEKTGRDLASSHQPERNRVINQTSPGPQ